MQKYISKQLALIGCGRLATPLAHQLVADGHSIVATTQHDKSTDSFADGIKHFSFDLTRCLKIPNEIFQSEVIIYTIPPPGSSICETFF